MMRKNNLTLGAMVLGMSLVTHATPTIYPKNFNLLSAIQNSTDSNLVADDQQANVVYVLPPNVAEAHMTQTHSPTTNLGFCKEMGNLQSYSADLSAQIKKLSEKSVQDQKQQDDMQNKINQAQAELNQYISLKNLGVVSDMDDKIAAMESRLQELYTQLQTCVKDCETMSDEASSLEKEKGELVKLRRQEIMKNTQDVREYEKRKVAVSAMSTNLDQMKKKNLEARQELFSIRKDFNEMYSQFGKMEGVRVNMLYRSQWDANVQKLRDDNSGFDFKKIQTSNAKVYASLKDFPELPQDTAVLAFEIPGEKVDNYISVKSGFPDSLEANVVLSLVGACPMVHPEYFNIPKGFNTQDVNYGLIISYEYPTLMNINATAKYNMYKMYQKIVSSGSRGGFFSSRSWTNVEERNYFRDVFKVEWNSQDDSMNLSDEKKVAIEADMRKQVFERLANLALPSAPNKNDILAAAAPQAHGAIVLSNSLMQTCPANVYCVGGSIILNVLDAIFGSSSTTASYLQTQDFEITEVWSNSKVVMKPWVTSYISQK